jgi:hypothetical protein
VPSASSAFATSPSGVLKKPEQSTLPGGIHLELRVPVL